MPSRIDRTKTKLITTNIMLVANAFVWYFLAFIVLKFLLSQSNSSEDQTILVLGINIVAIVFSALIGLNINGKLGKRIPFINLWTFVGIFISLLPLALSTADFNSVIWVSLVFGAYFGFGMPTIMGHYSANIQIENRGKIGGITLLLIGIFVSILGAVITGNIMIACLVLATIRLIGWIFFNGLRQFKEQEMQEKQNVPFRRIISEKPFILYFVSWTMFSLINYMTIPIQSSLFPEKDLSFLSNVFESIITAACAVVSGFVADRFGRKRLTIVAFIMVGIGYASLGLFQEKAIYFYFVADGIAVGIFYVVFLLTLWGDLARDRNSDKFYFLGALPFLLSSFMRYLFTPLLSEVNPFAITSFATLFLFLAVLPLYYAPETLPEKLMKDRDLKSYAEKALRKAQISTEKKEK